jgi:transposase
MTSMFASMNWIQGWDRKQRHLLPEEVEDYVGADNPVRCLDAFVEGLDMRALGFVFPKEDPQGRGRPAYHPAVLLKLYLYGYLYQVRSSRRLENECVRNLEVIWLLGRLRPDFKTIADFRTDNAAAFKQAVREFTRLCRQLELFGGELLAIDGTKMKAQNAPAKNWSQTKLQKEVERVEKRLKEYLAALDEADHEAPPPKALSAAQLKEKMERLRQRQSQAQERLEELQKNEQSQVSATDVDSRSMRGAGKHVVGYNVQGVVDAKHHLLAVVEATNSVVDQGQLAPMAQAAKTELAVERATVVADGAYYTREDIKACQDIGLEPHLPEVDYSPSKRAGLYTKNDFTYEGARDVYRCPAGQELTLRRTMKVEGAKIFNYDNPAACAACGFKAKCTRSAFRTLSRWEHEERLERMTAAVAAAPEKLKRRKTLIEHCWGTMKWLLPGGFLVRGLQKVGAEVSLAHFAYNLKRALAVLGLDKLLAALRKKAPSANPASSSAPSLPPDQWYLCAICHA